MKLIPPPILNTTLKPGLAYLLFWGLYILCMPMYPMWDNVRRMGLPLCIAGLALASHPLGEVHMNLLMLHGCDCLHGLHEDSHLAISQGKWPTIPVALGINATGKCWWLSSNWWIHETDCCKYTKLWWSIQDWAASLHISAHWDPRPTYSSQWASRQARR